MNAAKLVSLIKNTFHPAPTDVYHLQMLRSLVVSALALVINLGGYYILKQAFGVHYLIAALIGYCLGVLLNYYLSVKWVFATRKLSSRSHEFAVFVTINILGLGLYELLILIMVQGLSWSALVAPLIANVVVFFWNFLARKKVLY